MNTLLKLTTLLLMALPFIGCQSRREAMNRDEPWRETRWMVGIYFKDELITPETYGSLLTELQQEKVEYLSANLTVEVPSSIDSPESRSAYATWYRRGYGYGLMNRRLVVYLDLPHKAEREIDTREASQMGWYRGWSDTVFTPQNMGWGQPKNKSAQPTQFPANR